MSKIPASEQRVIDKLSEMDLNLVRTDFNFDSYSNFRKPLKLASVNFQPAWGAAQGYFVAMGHIVELNITLKNSLRTIPDIIIENLSELRVLTIEKSEIETLPENIENLKNLTALCISQNHLISLQENLGNLVKLRVLRLYRNRLHSLPENIGNLTNLEELDLRFNNLTRLPESFKNLKRYELRLDNNPLRSLSNINFDNMECYSFSTTHLSLKGRSLLHPLDWDDSKKASYYYDKDYQEELVERDLKPLAKYYEKSVIVLANKYCKDPKSLSPDELERLTWEAGQIERELLESRFPPENIVIRNINSRMKVELRNGYKILL